MAKGAPGVVAAGPETAPLQATRTTREKSASVAVRRRAKRITKLLGSVRAFPGGADAGCPDSTQGLRRRAVNPATFSRVLLHRNIVLRYHRKVSPDMRHFAGI